MIRLAVLHFQRQVDRDVGVTQWITRGERHPAAGGSWYVEVDRESGKDDTEELPLKRDLRVHILLRLNELDLHHLLLLYLPPLGLLDSVILAVVFQLSPTERRNNCSTQPLSSISLVTAGTQFSQLSKIPEPLVFNIWNYSAELLESLVTTK